MRCNRHPEYAKRSWMHFMAEGALDVGRVFTAYNPWSTVAAGDDQTRHLVRGDIVLAINGASLDGHAPGVVHRLMTNSNEPFIVFRVR